MKTINKRVFIIAVLAAVFTAAAVVLVFSIFTHAEEYALKTANNHLFSHGVLTSGGDIYDKNGEVLSYSKDGERYYSDDKNIRKATLHILGDNSGFISDGIQSNFKKELSGYSLIFGVNAEDKNSMKLTLDAKLCVTAYNALEGRKGTVGVYNYKTGEIICAVSSPTFDILNKPGDINSDDTGKYDGIYINRLFNGLYVPGSTFKTVTALAAVENIGDIFTRTFECTGEYDSGDGKVICNDVHGTVTFEDALNCSCNSAFAQIAGELGSEKLTAAFEQTGMGKSYDSDRVSTTSSRFKLSEGISKADLGWAGIGQYTTLINPYSMMLYMGAIANGGKSVTPYFVDSVSGEKGNIVYKNEKKDSGINISPSTASTMKTLLRSDVENYYGDYRFNGLTLCGKTGTAEVGDDKKPHAWFVGFSQDENFPYAFVAVVENAGGGLANAGPVIAKVLSSIE